MGRRRLLNNIISDNLNISEAVFVQEATLALTASDPKSLRVTDDGTKLFHGDRAGYVRKYSFGTPYDISTLSFVQASTQFPFLLDGYDIKDDGTMLFTVRGSGNGLLREYTLTTPYDLSTLAFVKEVNINVSCISPSFSRDGSRLYVFCNGAPDFIEQYDLSTPWDISTLSFVASQNNFSGAQSDVKISDNGKYIFYVHNNDNLYRQFNLSTPYDIQSSTVNSGLFMVNVRNGEIVQTGRKIYLLDYTDKLVSEYDF